MTNYERLTSGIKLYRDAMREYIGQRLRGAYGKGRWVREGILDALSPDQADRFRRALEDQRREGILTRGTPAEAAALDVYHFERVMRRSWDRVFKIPLQDQRKVLDWVKEVGEERHIWAHPPSGDLARADVNRVLDSCARVLRLVDVRVAAQVEALRDEEGRQSAVGSRQSEESDAVGARPAVPASADQPASGQQPVGERPAPLTESSALNPQSSPSRLPTADLPTAAPPLPAAPVKGLPPWRTVIYPHQDVQEGRYSQAEFAANLAEVLAGTAGAEYQEAVEFFRRTFLTAGIQGLLRAAVARLAGNGGAPVIQLKTSFGGGKTHPAGPLPPRHGRRPRLGAAGGAGPAAR